MSRSLSNPASTGDPDHYTRRIIGGDPHYNSTILSHAFYLAIEGGTNRTSGLTVQGVGAGNREQIEKAFFRALTVLLPSSATFALTRAATIQAARDLYGTGGAVERAITQAWDAVGVQPRTAPTAAIVPVPITPAQCPAVAQPSWGLYLTMSAGASNLVVNQWQLDSFDAAGVRESIPTRPPRRVVRIVFQLLRPGQQSRARADRCVRRTVYQSWRRTDERQRPGSPSPRPTMPIEP